MSTRFKCSGCGVDACTEVLVVCEKCASKIKETAPSASGNTGSPKFLLDIKEQCFLFIQRKYGCNSVSDEMDVAVDVYNFIEQKLRTGA
jgi:hypothetical protein